mmetsp:Transcript_1792/g.2649  ORF Transcript_1792/g.2649 Transcript_1792/m.2649 type:complete len:96 (+) Transcript_1792:635-922(+)
MDLLHQVPQGEKHRLILTMSDITKLCQYARDHESQMFRLFGAKASIIFPQRLRVGFLLHILNEHVNSSSCILVWCLFGFLLAELMADHLHHPKLR